MWLWSAGKTIKRRSVNRARRSDWIHGALSEIEVKVDMTWELIKARQHYTKASLI
jgi:hypothetical protein